MVFEDERVKYISEVFIGVLVTSIDTAMLIIELNSACNSLNNCAIMNRLILQLKRLTFKLSKFEFKEH